MPEILSIGELLDLGNSASTAGMIPYSALEYNGSGDISGISGSAIAGGVDSAVVSSIVSSYVESGVSGKVDQTAFDNCCSSVQSALSGKLDKSASGQFQPSGEYYSASNPSGFITSADLSSKLDASASSQFQPSGNYVFESSYSSFSGDVVNNISSMSSIVSGLTGDYLDKSASSMFQPSGGYVSASDMSAYVPFSGFEYSAGTQTITAISGSAIGGSDFDGVYTDNTLSGSGLYDSPLGVIHRNLVFGSSFIESTVGDTTTVNVNNDTIIRAVSSSAEATANGILYVVTGANI